ncbi:MAG: NifB/NifX family molybdenum-iron cluster-binding protein [Myxococcales bacterium]
MAIAIQGGSDLDARVDPHFGRAERFLVADAETGALVEVRDNTAAGDAHGAGTGAAGLVADLGAGEAIAGRFGPKAYDALRALGVAMYQVPEGLSARDALAQLRDGELAPLEVKVIA